MQCGVFQGLGHAPQLPPCPEQVVSILRTMSSSKHTTNRSRLRIHSRMFNFPACRVSQNPQECGANPRPQLPHPSPAHCCLHHRHCSPPSLSPHPSSCNTELRRNMQGADVTVFFRSTRNAAVNLPSRARTHTRSVYSKTNSCLNYMSCGSGQRLITGFSRKNPAKRSRETLSPFHHRGRSRCRQQPGRPSRAPGLFSGLSSPSPQTLLP